MDLNEIKSLLEEASRPDCDFARSNQIQVELSHAAELPPGETYSAQDLINALYAGAVNNAPAILPSLFPVFAIACGDRKDGFLVAEFPKGSTR